MTRLLSQASPRNCQQARDLAQGYRESTANAGVMEPPRDTGRPLLSLQEVESRLVFAKCKPFTLAMPGRQWSVCCHLGDYLPAKLLTDRPYLTGFSAGPWQRSKVAHVCNHPGRSFLPIYWSSLAFQGTAFFSSPRNLSDWPISQKRASPSERGRRNSDYRWRSIRMAAPRTVRRKRLTAVAVVPIVVLEDESSY